MAGLKSSTISFNVTGNPQLVRLCEGCFEDCPNIQSVYLPASVTMVDAAAFSGCTNLVQVHFNDETGESYAIPSLGENAFQNTHQNLRIEIPGVYAITINSNDTPTWYSNLSHLVAYQGDQEIWYCGARPSDPAASFGTILDNNGQGMDPQLYGGYIPIDMAVQPNVAKPQGITEVIHVDRYPRRIYAIADEAFKDNTYATYVSLPQLVRSIGERAFNGCTALKNFPALSNQWTGPNVLTSIGQFAFQGCSAMEGSVDARYVSSIYNGAFSSCSNISSVTLGPLTSIPWNLFVQCTNLQSVVINGDLNQIENTGYMAFAGCTHLTTFDTSAGTGIIKFPGATSVNAGSFQNCHAITTVSLGAITKIDNGAFNNCAALQSVTLSSTNALTTIGEEAFLSCSSLEKVGGQSLSTGVVLSQVTTVGKKAFAGTKISAIDLPAATTLNGESTFAGCTSLTTANLPNVTSVPSYGFMNCTALSYVNALQIQQVSSCAFYHCSSLGSLILPYVTSIQNKAFSGCTSLTSLKMGASLTNLGDYLFEGLSGTGKSLYFAGDVPTKTANTFRISADGTTDIFFDTIYILETYRDDYANAWQNAYGNYAYWNGSYD